VYMVGRLLCAYAYKAHVAPGQMIAGTERAADAYSVGHVPL